MNKDFTEYQEALELKQLGFDEPCLASYYRAGKKLDIAEYVRHGEYTVLAPLYQQAFRFFREKYNLEGIVQHAEERLWYKFHISTYVEYGKKTYTQVLNILPTKKQNLLAWLL
jgi:hypothetical protein